ncbi:MAG: electron transfer flavoprotein subunit alpha/FixB family protein, partial [Bacillota bacterium]
MSDVLVFIEHRNDRVIRACKQILGFFSLASDTKKFKIFAFIYGERIDQDVYDELSELGVCEVFSAIDENLSHYNPEIIMPFFKNVILPLHPQYILLSNTAIGKDLAPRLAQEFSAEMISDVTDITLKRKQLLFTRPIYGGKIFETIQPQNRAFVTIRANFSEETDRIRKNDMNISYVTAKRTKDLMYILKDAINKRDETKILTESEIIVCGGGGMKSAKNFMMLEELADLLGASVGASRAAVDAGYISRSALIGQTGKRVNPKLYLSFG